MTSKISDEELVNLFNKNKLFNLFNMTVLEVNTVAGSIKMEFEVEQKYCNPAGDVQGGIVSGMVDDATALAFIFQNHFKKRPPTIELKTNFLPKLSNSEASLNGELITDCQSLLIFTVLALKSSFKDAIIP